MAGSSLTGLSRLHGVLSQALALPVQDLAAAAPILHTLIGQYLAAQAGVAVKSYDADSNGSLPLLDSSPTRSAVLAVVQELSSLQSGIPIDLVTLHDFIIVYTAGQGLQASNEARLAHKIVEDLFRKKPSLAWAVDTQLLPGWTETFESLDESDNWLQNSKAVLCSIALLSKVSRVREALISSAAAPAFWSAFQTFYDLYLPKHFAKDLSASQIPLVQMPSFKTFIALRKALVDIFADFMPSLSPAILSESIESEASSPDLPSALTDHPLTTLINLTLLQDAEYYHHTSRSVGLRAAKGSEPTSEEKAYLQKALDYTKSIPWEDIADALASSSSHRKGKGKGRSTTEPDQNLAVGEMVQQVLAVLPETSPIDARRLLTSVELEQVSHEKKVERAISMLLEGDLPPEEAIPPESGVAPSTTAAAGEPAKQSVYSTVRRNIFTDSIDVSRLHRGKQDFANDTFLPAELRASILAAVQRQAQESEDEKDEDDRREDEVPFLEDDEDAPAQLKVRDDVSEESGLEDEEDKPQPSRPAPTTPVQARPSGSATPSATGVPIELEKLYMSTYTSNPSVFSRESRKLPVRATLKKNIAALKLQDSISDEQIEGWARMFERNPRKEKLLEKFADQGWRGNQKGMEVRPGSGPAKESSGNKDKKPEPDGQSRGGGQSARGGAGRGRGNRGGARQSDARRRGHDKKMAKAGL